MSHDACNEAWGAYRAFLQQVHVDRILQLLVLSHGCYSHVVVGTRETNHPSLHKCPHKEKLFRISDTGEVRQTHSKEQREKGLGADINSCQSVSEATVFRRFFENMSHLTVTVNRRND